ncbi:hypothetical protein SO802_031075 [Lithocarpus litseifolius]|uniref:DUF3741 domain-containing protein n=1 Tax=Lithocarpus litseifolius TaxID=425828 RepID=A0AAW2BJE8_9ROSI
MTHSHNANTGCFSNMVRRISCFGSLPTHPADYDTSDSKTSKSEEIQIENPKAEAAIQAPRNPGVVARLMGLDSLPETNWVPRKRPQDSVLRSKSMNFADYMLEFDLSQAQHRRVRTSVSFREVPTLSHQKSHDFLVVCLNEVDESETKGSMRSKVRKSEMGFADMKQGKEQRSKNKENKRASQVNNKISKLRDEPRRVSTKSNLSSKLGNGSNSNGAKRLSLVPTHKKKEYRNNVASLKAKSPSKPINQKKLLVEPKVTRRRKVQHLAVKVEPDSDSQNSSPVSVLEVSDCIMQQGSHISEVSRPMELKLERKSTAKVSYTDDPRVGAIKSKDCESMDISETQYYREVLGKLFRLTENDIKESNWKAKNFHGCEEFEEVCMEFEQQVLDVLLNQVLDELVEIPFENFLYTMPEETL